MKLHYLFSLALLFTVVGLSQSLYQGPQQGSVASGVAVNTSSFLESSMPVYADPRVHNKAQFTVAPDYLPASMLQKIKEPQFIVDQSTQGKDALTGDNIMLNGFEGIAQGNSIPPDPYLAVGPQHIIGTVNTSFGIWDKNGNKLKTIDINSWYASVLPGVSAFDPKVIYDQIAKRWVMVWLDQAQSPSPNRGNILVSVSHDSSALGIWYNYVFSAMVNGSTPVSTWLDYQGVGYDSSALYITGQQWDFSASNVFQYCKIKILPKSQLYANTGGAVNFFDIWDIRYPQSLSSQIFGVRPARMYTPANEFYLLQMNSNGANYCVVYKIKNPTTAPTMTGTVLSMASYYVAPTANQLGGGSPALESGGSALRNEPLYRNGKLYAVHAIQNPATSGYSSLHYFSIDVASNTVSEDYNYGAKGFFYFYPALTVDKNNNVGFSYSRSGDTEFAGAFYASKKSGATTISPSKTMKAGLGNYVVTFGGTRNRWGDYMGAWIDPSNDLDMWLISEYATSNNTWGTYLAQMRVTPYDGVNLKVVNNKIQFKPVEVGFKGDTLSASIINSGNVNLSIDSIAFSRSEFKLINAPTFPIALQTFDTLTFKLSFIPNNYSQVLDTAILYTNSGAFKTVPVVAKGYILSAAKTKTIYTVSSSGNVISLDKAAATATAVGASGYASLNGIAVHPKTKMVYAFRINESLTTDILRLNGPNGEAFAYATLPLTNVNSMAFDTAGTLYIAVKTGLLYTFNTATKVLQYRDSVKAQITSIAINPADNQMWGSVLKIVGASKDRIFKINKDTGDTTNIGNTGFNVAIAGLCFDESGSLYGLKAASASPSDLIKIDVTTGVGTLIGTTATTGLLGLTYDAGTISGVTRDSRPTPGAYTLAQNYPNPFNPSTTISFGLPEEANIEISVFNVLGEKITELFKGVKSAGTYSVVWDAASSRWSSGIYFYQLKARTAKGEFSEIKKMTLLK